MAETYREFAFAGPKTPVKGDDIGAGQVRLHHLHPSLYLEFQRMWQHKHEGASTVKLVKESFYTAPSVCTPVDPSVELVSGDPSVTTWQTVDVSANVSPRAIAVALHGLVKGTAAGQDLRMRGGGSTDTGNGILVQRTQVANVYNFGTKIVALNNDLEFEWSVSDATVINGVIIILVGYFETII